MKFVLEINMNDVAFVDERELPAIIHEVAAAVRTEHRPRVSISARYVRNGNGDKVGFWEIREG